MTAEATPSQAPPAFRTDEPNERLPSSSVSDRTDVHEGLSVLVTTTIHGVEELKPIWKQWPHGLETDIDYYLHNLRSDSTILHPHVITIWQDGIAQAMLVGQVRRQIISAYVSFVRLRGPNSKVLEIINGGRVGRQSSAIDKLLALELLKASNGGDVDLVCLQRLPVHSKLFREVRHLPGLLGRERVPHVSNYSVLSLTTSEGKRAVFGGKSRREVRRKTRILQRTFPGQVRLECYSHPSELDAGVRDAVTVAATTWQYYLGRCSLSDTAQTRDSFKFFAKQGWLRIYVLYVDEFPCAFLVGQLYNQTFYCQHAGYHPEFARFSVGSLLTAGTLEDLAAAGVGQVDLGDGRQEHHRRLGSQLRQEGTVHIYSATWRGVWCNLLFAATTVVRAGGRHTLAVLRINGVGDLWKEFLMARTRRRARSLPFAGLSSDSASCQGTGSRTLPIEPTGFNSTPFRRDNL
jgi:hypothetical protein